VINSNRVSLPLSIIPNQIPIDDLKYKTFPLFPDLCTTMGKFMGRDCATPNTCTYIFSAHFCRPRLYVATL